MQPLVRILVSLVILLCSLSPAISTGAKATVNCAPGHTYNPQTQRCEASTACPTDIFNSDTPQADSGLCQETGINLLAGPLVDLQLWSEPETTAAAPVTTAAPPLQILFFWGVGCPFCEAQKPLIEQLAGQYPQVELKSYEVYHDRDNQALFLDLINQHGVTSRSVPMTFIGERHWVGFRDIFMDEMKTEIDRLLSLDPPAAPATNAAEVISIPLLGDIQLGTMPLLLATFLIAFVDGFNPCSLWLLTILLGIVLHTHSRRKIIIVGLAFLLTTAAGYGAFMLGLLNVFMFVGYVDWIKIVVGLLALTFALVNIKDYFWFQQGLSFTISDKHKPGIFKKMRNIIHQDMSTLGMVGATVTMALGITLVELPCTAGFPVIWTNIVALHGVETLEFALLFATYLIIYLGIEIVILTVAVVTLKKSVFEEKHGRVLKLIGGVIMLVLAYGIVFAYDALGSLSGILTLFGAAAVIIALTLLIHRGLLPRLGIRFGSEKLPGTAKKEKDKAASLDKK